MAGLGEATARQAGLQGVTLWARAGPGRQAAHTRVCLQLLP